MTLETGKTYPLSLAWLSDAGALTSAPDGLTLDTHNADDSDNSVGYSPTDQPFSGPGWWIQEQTATSQTSTAHLGSLANADSLTDATFTAGDSGYSGTLAFIGWYGTPGVDGKPQVLVAIDIQIVAAAAQTPAIVIGPGV